uniref:NADH dehydrogenase subunit 5 n=1 Tax=Calacta lugubris TaxID=2880907 RepID=UPI001D108ECC|nr:NADH dehydrogenase subunit 5 [Calacta lugubris]UCC45929.1 NADH dehydrogenase subunit 5 [Calacta lugubris]
MFDFYGYSFWSFMFFVIGSLFFWLGLYFMSLDYSLFIDWEFYSLNSVCVYMTFIFDWLSLIFMGCVLYISSMVIYYSSAYMAGDIFSSRFLVLVLLFVFSMMFLIVSPNLVSILLGWDGLGLVSYCLVIYFQNFKSYCAGMLTVLINRVGDVAILVSIPWLFSLGGYNYLFSFFYYSPSMWVVYLIILASFTKSAQLPFSSWLPSAMAAPTPVSALVHSSTLVTAGVYLLIRFYPLLSNFDMSFFLLVSCLTMFMSGAVACFEFDLKKVIALSTLSQLGFMMGVLFLGYPLISYYHLLSHAFFKALLFLCAGVIIHSMEDSQDIRYMGFVVKHLPYTCSCFFISNFSLCGFPFLSGFYSKDLLLDYVSSGGFNLLIYILYFSSVGLTVCYTFRLIYYCVCGFSGFCVSQSYYEDSSMMFSMVFLTFMSVFFGVFFSWLFLPNLGLLSYPLECSLMPLILLFLGGSIGYLLSLLSLSDSKLGLSFSFSVAFLGSMWFMPVFSTSLLTYPVFSFTGACYVSIDSGWCEYLISSFPFSFISYLSKYLFSYQLNNLSLYLLSFLFWFLLILLIF